MHGLLINKDDSTFAGMHLTQSYCWANHDVRLTWPLCLFKVGGGGFLLFDAICIHIHTCAHTRTHIHTHTHTYAPLL